MYGSKYTYICTYRNIYAALHMLQDKEPNPPPHTHAYTHASTDVKMCKCIIMKEGNLLVIYLFYLI